MSTAFIANSLLFFCGSGGFLEYLCSGLTYPEETVKSAVVYILVQLSMKTPQNTLPTSVVQTVCQFVAFNLASAKSHNLTLNLLGIHVYIHTLVPSYFRGVLIVELHYVYMYTYT